jgi:hypothetical protein
LGTRTPWLSAFAFASTKISSEFIPGEGETMNTAPPMMTPSATREDMQNIRRFQAVRKALLSSDCRDYLEKPLAYWIVPTDRRLPIAFLSRDLAELLATPYEELARTPGIGRKKMASLVDLLARAVATVAENQAVSVAAAAEDPAAWLGAAERNWSLDDRVVVEDDASDGFDSKGVSEVQWERWRETVLRHGLGGDKLGRFAPSLRRVTKVIWNTPLAVFAGYTLAQMRSMKTYGEKRIHAVLEVFHSVHSMLSSIGSQPHLAVKVTPRAIEHIEQWVGRMLQTPGVPAEQDIRENLVRPLLQQIEIDAMPQIMTLAAHRLGLVGPPCSVRQSARNMGLTRARVYQLLNEINDIAVVRWPLGRHQLYQLQQKFDRESAEISPPPDLTQFHAAVELIFPGNRRGADGPLEYVADGFVEDDAALLEV